MHIAFCKPLMNQPVRARPAAVAGFRLASDVAKRVSDAWSAFGVLAERLSCLQKEDARGEISRMRDNFKEQKGKEGNGTKRT